MAKNVLQYDRAPLERREPHEGAQTGRGNLVVLIGGTRSSNHVKGLVIQHHWPARAGAQEVERSAMGDAEQPAVRVVEDAGIRQRGEGFHQGVLDNVLSIDGSAGHTRAIAMKLWTKLAHQPFELSARIIGDQVSSPQEGSPLKIIRRGAGGHNRCENRRRRPAYIADPRATRQPVLQPALGAGSSRSAA